MIPQILERYVHIKPHQASIWSQLDDQGQIRERLMIQRPLQENWIVIMPKVWSNNIIIQFLYLMEVSPMPTLISLEEHIPSTNQQKKEI